MSPNTISLLFPGQGSQSVGMGMALVSEFAVAKDVFAEVDEALGEDLSGLIANGPAEDLTLTRNTQPALMAVSIAAFRVLQDECGLMLPSIASAAGHSLGEYSAYCAAGALPLAETAQLLRLRGEAMQAAVPVGEGAMAAVLGLDMDALGAALEGSGAEIANDNAPGQIVISGSTAAVDAACLAAKEAGAKRAVLLPVSAPFHSSLMGPAQEAMAEALSNATVSAPKFPVYSNVLADIVSDPDVIRRTLTEQVTGRVRWTETVSTMAERGTTLFVEVGAGKVLSGLIRRIASGAKGISVGGPDDLDGFRDAVAH